MNLVFFAFYLKELFKRVIPPNYQFHAKRTAYVVIFDPHLYPVFTKVT